MIDLQFTDPELAALYDRLAPPTNRDDFQFYLPLLMAAESVLDIGCGTGALLHLAREAGHEGRLAGADPAEGMLKQARRRTDIEWIHGELGSVAMNGDFELAVMTGHAFQQLLTDDEIVGLFTAVKLVLAQGGRFVFETRNPLAREWERWPEIYSGEVADARGRAVKSVCAVHSDGTSGTVRFSHTLTADHWEAPRVSYGELRFVGHSELEALLDGAGLEIEEQYGNWDRAPVSVSSPEIITVAKGRLARRRKQGPFISGASRPARPARVRPPR